MSMRTITCILFAAFFLHGTSEAQTVIRGIVHDQVSRESVPAVSVTVEGKREGAYTDDKGRFHFTVDYPLPVSLQISSIGFETKHVQVTSATTPLEIELTPTASMGQEVVVSASRSEQKKLTSPVTIEQISHKEIIHSPQLNYYDMVQGLKGVDVTVSSIGFTSVTTRGFNTSGNTNFTQITDGMDNQMPGLNFALGSAIGLTQLDVDNIEVLSGASSALYGSRGLSGTMVMTGKDPFKYQGLSVQITQGVNHVKNAKSGDPVSPSPYYDWTIRYAKKINDKLAFKINAQYTGAKDWVATDTTNKNGSGNQYTDPNYNGVNIYGGATSTDINPFLQGAEAQVPELAPIIDPLLANGPNYVARTGYKEYGYLDNNATIFKANAELRYKISPRLEAIFSGTYGTGSVVYTNDTRYQLKNFQVGQYRAELKSDNWFFRAYTTQENSGHTLVAGPTAQLINEAWKPSYDANTGDGWYPQFTGALLGALGGGASQQDAFWQARQFADIGMPAIGSAQFNHLKDSISNTPITSGGTQFLDRSKLYNAEFQYNFSQLIPFMNVIAGANYRLYHLNSKGTLFADGDGPINVNEYSAYIQLSKKLLDNKLTLSASGRYDKNTLFTQPRFTTRFSAVYEVMKDNYIRMSYQNAYSFPSNIQSLQSTMTGYNSYSSGGSNRLLNGTYQFNQYPPYTLTSVQQYQQTNDPAVLQKFIYNDIKPQSVNAFELGYSSLIAKRVMIDVLGYYSSWQDFIGYTDVANTPGTQDPTAFKDHSTYVQYNIAFNGGQLVTTYGFAASASVDLKNNFLVKLNYYTDNLQNKNNSQVNNFNTPSYHINFEFSNSGFGNNKRWSFSTAMRYKPAYFYVVSGGFANGTVPASFVLDAQVSYKMPSIHSMFKLGSTNLTNKYYSTGVGNPNIGGVYYVTYAYNVF
jgi:outer membrane receptor for ferrienterochelin and colicin